jgi:hypothetical protein
MHPVSAGCVRYRRRVAPRSDARRADAEPVAASTRRATRPPLPDAVALAVAAVLVRIPALLAARHHHPDDGTYGVSAVAMRDGGIPFRDVFSSQGPLHLPLVWLFDLPRTAWSPRLSSLAAGAALAVVVHAIAWRLTDRAGALVAGALVALSGSALWTAGPITSDAPTALFVALALLAALAYDDDPSARRAVATGAAAAAAMLCKPALGAVGALPAVWLVARRRRPRDLAAAALVAAALGLGLALVFGPGDVWDQAVRYQLDSEREHSMLANARKVVSTLWDRDLPLLAAALVTLAFAALRRWRRAGGAAPVAGRRGLLGAWLVLVVAFLVLQPALWRNHLMAVVTPLALLAVTGGAPRRWLLVAIAAAAPLHVAHAWDILDPPPYDAATADAAARIAALPAGAQVLSDEVGIVWRAGRRTPDDFVDASIKQVQQGRIDAARIASAAGRPEVCAVLVWRSTHWGAFADLPGRLFAAGYEVAARFPGSAGARVLYADPACSRP